MDNSTLSNRQKQSLDTKNKILTKTIELFSQLEYEQVTIRKICEGSNISIGTFYLYFKSKHEILFELCKKTEKAFQGTDVLYNQNLSSKEKILELARIQFGIPKITNCNEQFVKQLGKQLFIYQINSDSDYFSSEERKFFEIIKVAVKEGQNKKEIRSDMSSKDITYRILRFSRGIWYDLLTQKSEKDAINLSIIELSLYLDVFNYSKAVS